MSEGKLGLVRDGSSAYRRFNSSKNRNEHVFGRRVPLKDFSIKWRKNYGVLFFN